MRPQMDVIRRKRGHNGRDKLAEDIMSKKQFKFVIYLGAYLDLRSNNVHVLWNTKLLLSVHESRTTTMSRLPVFVTNTVCNGDVWKLSHDALGGGIHEIESPSIVGLFKLIL